MTASMLLVFPDGGSAQTAAPSNAVTEASMLRNRGAFAEAIRLLREHLQRYPDDGDAARLLAQTLYWLKDFSGARAQYERAMVQHPEDTALRLDYARMLVETRDDARAMEILSQLQSIETTHARAETLLGTMAYWRGDFTAAARHFEAALRSDPSQEEARRQLKEILSISAPWLRLTADGGRDDQPLTRASARLEAGGFLTPLVKLSGHIEPMQFRGADTVTLNILQAEGLVSGFSPAAHLELEVAGGVSARSTGDASSELTGRVVARFRLPKRLFVGGRVERAPYLHTIASLSNPIMTETVSGSAGIDEVRGWLGETALQRQQYPDGNAVTTGYAWLLAPIVKQGATLARLGYAFTSQDSKASRFSAVNPGQSTPGGFNTDGRYDPYYTPSNIVSHSAIFAFSQNLTTLTSFQFGGSYAIHATQDAPSFVIAAPPPRLERRFTRTTFTPWDAQASLSTSSANGFGIDVSAGYRKTAFYSAYTFALGAIYRFTALAVHRADRL